jgi:hypothetical protein
MPEDVVSPTFLKWLFTVFLVTGVLFYVAWGFAFNAFLDYANYTISAALIFTGLFGTLLYREMEKEKAAGAKPQ